MVLSFLKVTTFRRSSILDTVPAAEWALPLAHFRTAAVSTGSTGEDTRPDQAGASGDARMGW
jgi:hypothetical protein